jgi:hypothetical protein
MNPEKRDSRGGDPRETGCLTEGTRPMRQKLLPHLHRKTRDGSIVKVCRYLGLLVGLLLLYLQGLTGDVPLILNLDLSLREDHRRYGV